MGHAKTRVQREQENHIRRMKRLSYLQTIPLRILKGLAGIIAFPILLPFALFSECFAKNKWPWELIS